MASFSNAPAQPASVPPNGHNMAGNDPLGLFDTFTSADDAVLKVADEDVAVVDAENG